MYLNPVRNYYGTDGVQRASRGYFLILMQVGIDSPIRGIVRRVALVQCGHWMMGYARIKGEQLILSGSYGNDGLPMTVSEKVYNEGVELPKDLVRRWATDTEGWNSAGSEALHMRLWARDNLEKLYRVRRRNRVY